MQNIKVNEKDNSTVMKKKSKSTKSRIADNKKARYDYFIEKTIEAGLQLEGWEVKSLRTGQTQLREGYVNLKNGEAWLIGVHISPLKTTSTHIKADPTRSRKLLLNRSELDHLAGAVERKGFTLIPLNFHWKRGKIKLEIGLGKGKKQHDKRQTIKERDWSRQKSRLIKNLN